jgi:hypothetical protein
MGEADLGRLGHGLLRWTFLALCDDGRRPERSPATQITDRHFQHSQRGSEFRIDVLDRQASCLSIQE